MRHFARLKLRVLGNGLRGQAWRVGLFAVGCSFGLLFACLGFLLFALPGLAGDDTSHRDASVALLGLGGGAVVLGWLLLPLAFFGVDETLDPARFALLPLRRRTLLAGLTVAGLVGVPAFGTAIATSGSVVTAAAAGGVGAALVQTVGVIVGLFLCLIASRAMTSAFAGMLRSRRMRDLAAVLLAVLAGLLGPLQLGVVALLGTADLDAMAAAGRTVSWTPLGAPYTVGLDIADGRPLYAVAKLAGTVLAIGLLLWWWSRSLESAMVGGESSGRASARATGTGGKGGKGTAAGPAGGTSAAAALFPWAVAWAPRNRYGALVAREVRYWWRDARRRASLITIAVVAVFVPVMMNLSGPLLGEDAPEPSALGATASMLFIGTLAALTLANQFGYDGTAYAAHLAVGVRGRTELGARLVAFSLYMVPVLVGVAVLLAVLLDRPGLLPSMLGGLAAAYGAGAGINTIISVLGAYALPETSNPFAINTGAGVAKSLLSFVSLGGSLAVSAPFLAGAVLLDEVWTVLALPLGLGYGLGAALLACYIAGDALDNRAPELLQAVTPRA